MKKIYIIANFLATFLCTICCTNNLMAQTESEISAKADKYANEIRQFKNEFNFNTTGIISGFYGITFKRKIEEKKFVQVNKKRQMRYGVDFYTQATVSENKIDDTVYTNGHGGSVLYNRYYGSKPRNYQKYAMNIGYEVQNGLKKKIVLFYGADIAISYQRANALFDTEEEARFYYYTLYANTADNQLKQTAIRAGIVPFVGLRYYFLPYLSVGIETGAHIGYQQNIIHFDIDNKTYKGHALYNKFYGIRALSVNVGF